MVRHFSLLLPLLPILSSSLPLPLRGGTSAVITPDLEARRGANAAAGIPQPTPSQLTALAHPFTLFMHYSMCTYTGCQWNTAVSPAQDFAPPDAGPNATQWAAAAAAAGATQICLTVRHVGGFALWPSRTTNYSVAASGWRGGKGDVVAEFVAAVRAAGVSPCLYVILGFDVEAAHAGVPGPLYLDRQVEVLTELLTGYGAIDRLWWDNYAIGCCQPVTHEYLFCAGGGTTSTPGPSCPGWQVLIDAVRTLSPATAIVPGPDGCLVNGEQMGGTYPLCELAFLRSAPTAAATRFFHHVSHSPARAQTTPPRCRRTPTPAPRPARPLGAPFSRCPSPTFPWQRAGSGAPTTAASAPAK